MNRPPDKTTARARQMRRAPTEPERRLWAVLYELRQRGYHFRRQYPIGPYFADIACVAEKLVIEADGATHTDPEDRAYDTARADDIAARGYRILRFWNNDIMENPSGVFDTIAAHLSPLTPTPRRDTPRRPLRTGLRDLAQRTGAP